jgi:hypothetical protein
MQLIVHKAGISILTLSILLGYLPEKSFIVEDLAHFLTISLTLYQTFRIR